MHAKLSLFWIILDECLEESDRYVEIMEEFLVELDKFHFALDRNRVLLDGCKLVEGQKTGHWKETG